MNNTKPALTPDMIEKAQFPLELLQLVQSGKLTFFSQRDNGTLVFQIPGMDETFSDTELVWHPEDSKTWSYEGVRFYAKTETYHDKRKTSFAGGEVIPDLDTLEQLVEWLNG